MFDINICQFVPHRKNEFDLQPLHFVLEVNGVSENDSELSVYRVYFVLEGEGEFSNKFGKHALHQGDVIFCLPGKRFSLLAREKFKYSYISFIGLRASQITENLKITEKNCVFHNVMELLSIWKNALPVPTSVIDLRAEAVLLYTASVLGAKIDSSSTINLEVNAATEAKKYVDAHFSDPQLSLSSVCKALSYSQKYLSSVFTKQYKINFSKYLNSIRIEHACSLIERGHVSIKTVAFMCGFNDPLYFSKVFKSFRKYSPRIYIKQFKGDKN